MADGPATVAVAVAVLRKVPVSGSASWAYEIRARALALARPSDAGGLGSGDERRALRGRGAACMQPALFCGRTRRRSADGTAALQDMIAFEHWERLIKKENGARAEVVRSCAESGRAAGVLPAWARGEGPGTDSGPR